MPAADERVPVLYLAPWVDVGGSDKGTIDWFRFLDRDRFRPSLITTQPSLNRRLNEVAPYADEIWDLPDLMTGDESARFILTFIYTRGIKVLHVMNARLGFELLPQIARLPTPPRIVVQLHVEELDRSGYVRYVTTRYGNLVDAFSVSSQALSDRLAAYDVPVAKRRLIHTGVDTAGEFCPARVVQRAGLDPEFFHILFPARLTAQKDPLLMVEVAALLRAEGLRFRLHVLGDGDLASAVRDRIRALELESEVIMHGECVDVAPWYAACDMLLLTSVFEGVPYVAYEAMSMSMALVAPNLPGVEELVTGGTGVLVSAREDPVAYAEAIRTLAADPQRRRAIGDAARLRASEFPLGRMAAEHGALYDELLATPFVAASGPVLRARQAASACAPTPALRSRGSRTAELVSVIVPCFNHGQYLRACVQSIAGQTYAPIETIVVDDGSTDPGTLEALAETEQSGAATVVRMPTNGGPSAARNAAIERAKGRYVLPVDADNVLLPAAVATLVRQLRSAGERIGFIYPNLQFFGNRTDYFEPPSYNLDALARSNYCDTSSLIDGEVFDRGFRFPAEVVLGHEDWDFFLTLAEHGIHGEPAQAKTLLFRKHGYTRSDRVDPRFAGSLATNHPGLFAPRARAELKGEWNPAVSIIALDPLAERTGSVVRRLLMMADRQTCADFEVVIRAADDLWPTELGRRLRRVPSAGARSRAQALAQGLEASRGHYVLASYGSAAALLADRTLIERVLRVLSASPGVDALALADAGPDLRAFSVLDADALGRAQLGALCWAVTGANAPPPRLELEGHRPLETLARWHYLNASAQWRHLPRRDRHAVGAAGDGPSAALGSPRDVRPRDARIRSDSVPQLPDLTADVEDSISWQEVWTPPQARVLCRYLHHASQRYLFANHDRPPSGSSLDFALGSVRGFPLAGTTSLIVRDDSNGDGPAFALGEPADIDDTELVGFVEQAPLPGFDPLQIGRHRASGQKILLAGTHDPLAGAVDELVGIGYIEAYPIHPRQLPPPSHIDIPYGLAGLVRTLDLGARRHRYGVGDTPAGVFAGELGALLTGPGGDCEPIWISADGLLLEDNRPDRPNGRPSLATAIRWAADPLTWSGAGRLMPRVRAAGRRAYESGRILASKPVQRPSPSAPTGYLLRSPTTQTIPLYSATHPVTGDRLLSTLEAEADELGYGNVKLIGHLVDLAFVTDTLGVVRHAMPWASNFGRVIGGS